MVIPGYDLDDIDEALETYMDEGEIEQLLDDDELQSYRAGETGLVDHLTGTEIRDLLDEKEISLDEMK
jgi:hypothetical protein